jgi:hypothetical protein
MKLKQPADIFAAEGSENFPLADAARRRFCFDATFSLSIKVE